MSKTQRLNTDLVDDFPQTPARAAVVAVVRGYGMVQRLMGPYLARFGLTPPQFQVLTVINRLASQRLTQRRLAGELYVSFPNATIMLARLEEMRLVRRRPNPEDRRERFVRLTRAGHMLLQRIWKEHQTQHDRVVKGLNVEEQVLLARLLDKMSAANRSSADAKSECAQE